MSGDESATTVKCGECGGDLNTPPNPQPTDEVSCQSCPNKASYQEVLDEAQAYFDDYCAAKMDEVMKDAIRDSKFVKYEPGPKQTRKYRFVLDL